VKTVVVGAGAWGTAFVLRDLAHRLGIEMPITEGVCEVLSGTPIHELAASLMVRPPVQE